MQNDVALRLRPQGLLSIVSDRNCFNSRKFINYIDNIRQRDTLRMFITCTSTRTHTYTHVHTYTHMYYTQVLLIWIAGMQYSWIFLIWTLITWPPPSTRQVSSLLEFLLQTVEKFVFPKILHLHIDPYG